MRVLKGVVITFGVLILIGFGVLIGAMLRIATVPAGVADLAARAPFQTPVEAPPGTHLDEVLTAGDQVLLHFTGEAGDRLVVVDAKSGALAGTIAVPPVPGGPPAPAPAPATVPAPPPTR